MKENKETWNIVKQFNFTIENSFHLYVSLTCKRIENLGFGFRMQFLERHAKQNDEKKRESERESTGRPKE